MDNLKKRLNRKGGFTLVELLVVIAIIAVLSVTAYVALGGQTAKARNSRRQQDLSAIQNALEIYFVENFSKYPDQLADNGNPADVEVEPKYMPELPVDPIPQSGGGDNDYVYAVNGTNKFYELATVIEEEDGTYTSYVIGNSDTALITAGFDASCAASVCNVTDGSTTCLPYCP